MSVADSWGTSAEEQNLSFDCDKVIRGVNGGYWRGVSVAAPPELVYRWLCQLRVAPYSYDWIDNLGRTSPPQLRPGLDKLAIGQTMMFIFKVMSFAPNEQITVATGEGGLFRYITGAGAISYRLVKPDAGLSDCCRLIAKLAMAYPPGPGGWLNRQLLPWGDLVMMRRQLLNFKRLAERDYSESS